MGPKDCIVSRIEGEYAYLADMETGAEVFIAPALLPSGTTLGSKLHCEMFEYTLIE